jgi:hypothetical protein
VTPKVAFMIAVATRIVASVAVAFFTVQALYWPLIPKPGTEFYWWQLKWAAEIGYFVGAPVIGIVLLSPLQGPAQHLLALGLTAIWFVVIFLAIRSISNVVLRRVERNAT